MTWTRSVFAVLCMCIVHKREGLLVSVSGPYHVRVGCEAGHMPGGTGWSALTSSIAGHTLTSGQLHDVGISTGRWRLAAIWPANVTNSENWVLARVLRHATPVQEGSTDSHRSPSYIIFQRISFRMQKPRNTRRYDLTMRMRILLVVTFLFACFRRFLCRLLGLINLSHNSGAALIYWKHNLECRLGFSS